MPKIIQDAKAEILSAARNRLLHDGGFSMRAIAKDCGISPGTIYHYYPDAGTLIAMVLVEDWQKAYKEMQESAEHSATAGEALTSFIHIIRGFRNTFGTVFEQYGNRYGSRSVFDERHRELRKEIADLIHISLKNRNSEFKDEMIDFFAEMILAAGSHEELSAEAPAIMMDRLIRLEE